MEGIKKKIFNSRLIAKIFKNKGENGKLFFTKECQIRILIFLNDRI